MITLSSTSTLPSAYAGANCDYYEDCTYGDASTNKTFDFLKTKVFEEAAPLVMYVHGGGFTGGDKTLFQVSLEAVEIVKLVNLGFSVISINYPLIVANDTVGVQKCLNAIEEALIDFRANATLLNIDPTKVGYRGKSAGSGAGMYLAGRPNPPNAFAVNRPMPLDALDWPNYFTTIDLQWMVDRDAERFYNFYGMPWTGTPDITDFDDPSVISYAQSLDTVANLQANSGIREFWFNNNGSTAEPTNVAELIHHPNYTQAFHDKVTSIGWRSNYYTETTPPVTISQFFKNSLFPIAENNLMASMGSLYFTPPDIDVNYSDWWGYTDTIRMQSVDWNAPKVNGNFQKLPEAIIDNHLYFASKFALNIRYMVFPYSTGIGSMTPELDYIDWLINTKGAPITSFEVGYEFWLNKFKNGNTSDKKVLERVSQEAPYSDYTDMLDLWIPALYARFPSVELVICGSHRIGESYRITYDDAVNVWLSTNKSTYPNLAKSYHLYAGTSPGSTEEDDVLLPQDVDYAWLNNIPDGIRWIATETNYYPADFSAGELALAKQFWQLQYDALRVRDEAGIFPIWKTVYLPMFDETGILPLGLEYKSWLANSIPPLVETNVSLAFKRMQLVSNSNVKLKLKLPVET